MPEVITVGETMAALTPANAGPLRYMKNFEMRVAGAESNLAIGICKLGHTAGWVSRLGEDEFGHFIRNSIRAEGVDTSRVLFDREYRSGVMFKQVRSAGETSVFYYRENSAASQMAEPVLDEEYLAGAKILHLTGITPVLSESCREMLAGVMELAGKHDVMVSFDPNIRKKLWQGRDYVPVLREMVLKARIVLMGLDESEILLGTGDTDKIFDILFSEGDAKYVAIKNGANGAYCAGHEERLFVPPHPCHCVDPIGAGDAFNAGFLCGILEERSLQECGVIGAVAGAWATETFGDIEGYPSREQLDEIISGGKGGYR